TLVTVDVVELAVLGTTVNNGTTLLSPPELTPAQESKLWRKMDLRLLPILAFIFLMAYMDRGPLGNARLEGLDTQLRLKGYDFNIALLVFFIPYMLFESPSKWLPFLTTSLGVTLFTMLVLNRVMLGALEAGLFPGMAYYLTFWYPRDKLQLRISLFYGSASLAGAFSGLLAYGIGFMSGLGGLLGWSWIFILEGIMTFIVGIVANFVIVDTPSSAKFLTAEQRAFVIHRKKQDTAGIGEEEQLEARHLWAALSDWQVWVQGLILLCAAVPHPSSKSKLRFLWRIVSLLTLTWISFGFSTPISQLLTVPPYVVGTIAVYTTGYYSDKLKTRYPFIFGGLVTAFMGLSMNIMDLPVKMKYMGTFAIVSGTYGVVPGIIAWLGNNLCGQSKRCVGMAIQISIANIGGIIASLIYNTQDSPRYLIGHGTSITFVAIGLWTIPITVVAYQRANQQREGVLREMRERGERLSPEEIKSLGDRSPTFKYMI
ncbi:MFS general substrate transporter, partial [Amanita rubescens]